MKNINDIVSAMPGTGHIKDELHLFYSITRSIIESKDFESALEVTLKKICSLTGWVYGEVWIPNEDRKYLEYSKVTYSNIKSMEGFGIESKNFKFPPGVGFPGRVWSSKKSGWISDVALNTNFLRKRIATDFGLKAAIGIPVIDESEVIAVIVFFTNEVKKKDERLIELISNIALQLGVFISHIKTKESLHRSERENRTILDNMPDIFYRTNKDGQLIKLSKAVKEILDYEPEDLIGKGVADLYVGQDERGKFLKKLEENGGKINDYEVLLSRKDGSHVWISTNLQYYRDENGNIAGVEGIGRDVTERKRLEDELLKARKLEAIGVLAGGIAHDFNNLLTAIVCNIGLAKMRLRPDNEMFDWLTNAENACSEAKELSNRLITFSKGGKPVRKEISISELIREAVSELIRGADIICECNFPNDINPVKIDESQIRQVVKNIVINAKESMPKGGILKINAEKIIVTGKENLSLQKGDYIKLSIEDSGKGIEEENLPRIFDPYFTTKEMGSEKGRGLGLSICYSIIKKHDGLITVDSREGAGTKVNIYLPAAAKRPSVELNHNSSPLAYNLSAGRGLG